MMLSARKMKLPSTLLILLSLFTSSMTMHAKMPIVIAGQPGHEGYVDGKATDARFENPNGLLLLPDESLLIADSGNFRLRLLEAGKVRTFAGSGEQRKTDGKTFQETAFAGPDCLERLPNGAIIVGDSSCVRMIAPDGQASTWLDLLGTVPGSPAHIVDLLSVADAVYICDRINRRIYSKKGDSPLSLLFTCEREPHSLAARPNGDVLIGEYERIIGVRKDGTSYIYHSPDHDKEEPLSDLIVGMEFDALGRLIIADAYCGLLVLKEGQPVEQISEIHEDVSALVLTKDKKKVYASTIHSIVLIDLAE